MSGPSEGSAMVYSIASRSETTPSSGSRMSRVVVTTEEGGSDMSALAMECATSVCAGTACAAAARMSRGMRGTAWRCLGIVFLGGSKR